MKQFIVNGLAVVGAGCLGIKLGCYFLDRYKDDILDYVAGTLVDYITKENEEEKSTGDKIKKKMLLAYLKKGANK